MRTVKPCSIPARESTQASAERLIGSGEIVDRLYWSHAEDLLFAVRLSQGGRFIYEGINPAFEALLGMSSRDVQELNVSDCMRREDAESVCEALRASLAAGAEVRIRHGLALRGSRQNVETTVVPVLDPADGLVIRLIGSHHILRKELLEGPTEGAADLRSTVSLASIQEDIQQRIASELHDSTCQHLIAASLGLMRIRTSFGDPAAAARICDGIDSSIDEALREIRAITYLLHPQNLSVDGLKATIEHYARGFAARTLLKVSVRISALVDRLPYETQRSLLRVTQEALSNVFRHAKATEVKIVLDATDQHFRLTISDNGRGFPVSQARHGASPISIGVGIPAMRARLEQLGGTLDIRSDPAARPSGTTLCAVFPNGLATNRRHRRKQLES